MCGMHFFGFSRQAFLVLLTLLAGIAASPSSHAFGRSLKAPDRCDFSAKPKKYEALLEKFLGGARKPGNPGRPPAMVLDLVDASGKILRRLHESSPHDPRAVASTQKTITAWVASRSTPLDRSVTYLEEDDWHDSANDGNPAVRRDKSRIRVGEAVTVRELLQTMLEQSSNAAASALARAAAGTHRDFVRQMNSSVRELLDDQSVDTYFQNSSGLTDAQDPLKLGELPTIQHSTADNMARMLAKMMARPSDPQSFDFHQMLENLEVENFTGEGIFEKYGRTRAAGRTVVVHWRLPVDCHPGADAVVLSAFGGHDDQISNFVLAIERLIGLRSLRTHTLVLP